MLQFILLFIALAQDFTSRRIVINVNGHDYSLFCRMAGESVSTLGSMCLGVDHFEVRDEAGRVQFALDTPDDNPFSAVDIHGGTYNNTDFFRVSVTHDEEHGRDADPLYVYYEFDPTPSGLAPVDPPIVCPPEGRGGMGQAGAMLSCSLNLGYVRTEVLLKKNGRNHRIEIDQRKQGYPVFAPFGQSSPRQSNDSGQIKIYSDHQIDAPSSALKIEPKHSVIWWQSRFPSDAPHAGQTIMILTAWAPVSLTASDRIPAGAEMVRCNAEDLWLQISVDNQTGWIHGPNSFRTVGLRIP